MVENAGAYAPHDVARHSHYAAKETLQPERAKPDDHTMGKKNFLRYIGRLDPITDEPLGLHNLSIHCKKFTDAQADLLQRAYQLGLQVRVIGAYRRDASFLLTKHDRRPISPLREHVKSGKRFNDKRAVVVLNSPSAESSDEPTPASELWILVYPSAQYVDQMSELVLAILEDFSSRAHPLNDERPPAPRVETWHYRSLEQCVADWTGFEDSLAAYVRHGDAVVIGNVELLLPGLQAVGFTTKFQDWHPFGLDDNFGVQIVVNGSSFSRLVLIGFRECFWGEASARYVEALLRTGARHILYGSKAASMNSPSDINGTRSPGSFSIYSRGRSNQGLTQLNSTLTDNEALKHLAELAKIETVGIGVTVPTVIGETIDQRNTLNNLNPSTMDDEDGHIARVVQRYNQTMDGGDDAVAFLPVHFISDYIHRGGESVHAGQMNLAVTEPDKRDPAFKRIGSFFGVYATIFGLREYAPMPEAATRTSNVGSNVGERIASVTHLLNAGMVREAIFAIAGSDRTEGLPPVSLQAIALICQKYGFLDDAIYMLSLLQDESIVRKLSETDRIRLAVMRIKVHTQSGQFLQAEAEATQLVDRYAHQTLTASGMLPSVYRRLALSAAKRGSWSDAMHLFDTASSLSTGADAFHASATNIVFRHIAQLSTGAPILNEPSWRASLANARADYYHASKDAPIWQANPDKSALSALFAEAALHLDSKGIDDPSGIRRLYAAHLLNIRVGGTERSEGFGELIAFIEDPLTKDLFRRAMRMDGIGRKAFQRVPHSMHMLADVQEVLSIHHVGILRRGEHLNRMLDRLDRRDTRRI